MPGWSKARVALLGVSTVTLGALAAGGIVLRAAAGDGSYRQVVTFSEVLALVLENYVDEPDTSRLLSGAYEGLLSGLDANGAYLDAEEVAAWRAPLPDDAAGPGVVGLKAGGSFQIVAVAPRSSADLAGLRPGDQIRSIDDVAVRGESVAQLTRRLLGPAGSTVRLSVIRPREGFRRDDVELVRQPRKDGPFLLERRGKVSVLTPVDVARIDPDAVRAALLEVRDEGAERLLLDLRSVSSVDVRDAAGLLGLFAAGPVLQLKDKKGAVAETLTGGEGGAWEGPVAALVGGATAGSGEAVAQVLRARRGAVLYGEPTYGLGTDPKLFDLPSGDGLLVPALAWEPVGGTTWVRGGIEPDRVVRGEGKPDDLEGDQLRRAVELFSEAEAPVRRDAA